MQTVISSEEYGTSGSASSNRKSGQTALNGHTASCGTMTLYIRSKRKYVGSQIVNMPSIMPGISPMIIKEPRRIAMYEDSIDDEQSEAMKNSKMLADNLCLDLEVRDVAHMNPFTRFLGLFLKNRVVPRTPSLSFAEAGLVSLVSSKYSRAD